MSWVSELIDEAREELRQVVGSVGAEVRIGPGGVDVELVSPEAQRRAVLMAAGALILGYLIGRARS